MAVAFRLPQRRTILLAATAVGAVGVVIAAWLPEQGAPKMFWVAVCVALFFVPVAADLAWSRLRDGSIAAVRLRYLQRGKLAPAWRVPLAGFGVAPLHPESRTLRHRYLRR